MAPKRGRDPLLDDRSRELPAFAYRVSNPTMVQAQNFAKFSTFYFIPTRFLDWDDFARLGILEELQNLINGIGWMRVADITEPAYREPTVEFLSSVQLIHPTDDEPHYSVKYRLLNQEHQLSLAAFNVALGFETEETVHSDEYRTALRDVPEDFHDGAFWHQITGGRRYEPKVAKSSAILDPALRILHRWLAMSIYGRKDSTGNVSRHHLFILWAAHH